METKSRTSPEQFLALLEFMESNGDIGRPQPGPMGRIKADRLWFNIEGLLNGIGGGDTKPVSKWKKVWVDWKAKIKKKAFQMRREASATGVSPSRRRVLTDIEQRVLAVMGLNVVWGQVGIEERGFDDLPPTTSPLPIIHLAQMSSDENSFGNDFVITNTHKALTGSSQSVVDQPTTPAPAQPTVQVPQPVASPNASTSEKHRRRRQRPTHSSSGASSTPRAPRRQYFVRARRILTPLERASMQFVAVENRRLQLEVERERNFHIREMERLRIEALRVEVDQERNQFFSQFITLLEHGDITISRLSSS